MRSVRHGALLAALLGLLAAVLLPGSAAATGRAMWDTRVFSSVPRPGFPAYVYVHPNGRVYGGTYTNLTGDTMPARVFEWDAHGMLVRSWTPPGQDRTKELGVQVATSDARGRLVLLEKSRARVMTLDTRTGTFVTQAVLPNLGSTHAIPNYASWGPGGALYVTDYGQGVIWRIPATGGKPVVWFRSAKLAATEFGTTGIVWLPTTRTFLIGQQTTSDVTDLLRGHVYALPTTSSGGPGAIRTLWTSGPMELPDGFGVARSGAIYVALLGTNQLVKLSAAGKEVSRFPSTPLLGTNNSPVPFDSPSNATFQGTHVLVANQSAVTGTAANQVVLDVEVGEYGMPPARSASSTLR